MSTDERADTEDGTVEETRNWPELLTGVYEQASGGAGTLTLRLQDMDIDVPSRTGPDAERAHWTLDGTIELGEREE